MQSLRATIFVFVLVLLLAVQGAFLLITYRTIQQQENSRVEFQLESATRLFQSHFESRRDYLAAFAETAARDFGLKQVFEEDTRSFLVALNNHRERIDADIAMGVTADGTVSGQLITVPRETDSGREQVAVGPSQGNAFAFPQWLETQDDSRLYPLQDTFYQLSLFPLRTGATVIGWVGFGYRIDTELARYFSSLTGLDTEFWLRGPGDDWRLLAGSPSGGGSAESVSLTGDAELAGQAMRGEVPDSVVATMQSIGQVEGQQLVSLMVGDRTDILAEIRGHWFELLVLAALALLLSLGGTYFIASRISRPVQRLVQQARQVAGGHYDQPLTLETGGELGELAEEFRHMQDAVLSREKRIAHQANHEELTGLPNLRRLMQVLEELTDRPQEPFSVTKLSIRRMEEINSSFGHALGDEVIRTAAHRLEKLSAPDRLFHLGSNEFVLLQNLKMDHTGDDEGRSLTTGMDPNFRYQGLSLYIEIQSGIALFPEHDDSAAGLLQKASTALQNARKNAGSQQVYHPLMSRENADQLQLLNDLKYAIEQDQLLLNYQPKLTLATGQISHVEALVRWEHPEHGMMPPDRFIGLAEQSGLINALTQWVLAEASRQASEWRDQGLPLAIAINVSAHNLRDSHFQRWVTDTLQQCGLDSDTLCLEITENAVVEDPASAARLLGDLASDGIQLSIDDYGTGYSSLTQLKQLPVRELKVDKSFVLGLIHDESNRIIVRSTIELAHNMGLRVVAEGVEDAESLRWLEANGCDLAQGFHICRPSSAEVIGSWMRENAATFRRF